MGEAGKVIEVMGNNIKIAMKRTEACAKCKAYTREMAKEEIILIAENTCGAKEGDIVNVELNEGVFVFESLTMYGAPLMMLLFGFFLAELFFANIGVQSNEIFIFITGIAFMILSYIIVFKNSHFFENKKYKPIATKIPYK